jgi:ribosomal protein S18 acetylase RimI-like enzyme
MPEKEMLIRQATRQDVSEVVRLLSDDLLGSQREKYESPLPQSYFDAFARIEQDENNELIVVEMGAEIVATLQLTFLPGMTYQGSMRAQIEAVRVDGRYRNQRIGQKLVEWAVSRARQKGCYQVQLTTDKSRRDAHRFYERLGFVASHEGMKLSLH